MDIRKLYRTKEETKPYTRSFRLRNSALNGLNTIAEVTQLSANDIVNISMETLGKEYRLIEEIKQLLKTEPAIVLSKTTDFGYTFEIVLSKSKKKEHYLFRYVVKHPLIKDESVNHFFISKIEDLFDFGLDESFVINHSPKPPKK